MATKKYTCPPQSATGAGTFSDNLVGLQLVAEEVLRKVILNLLHRQMKRQIEVLVQVLFQVQSI